MWPNLQETADLVTFAEEICNGKLHFLCSELIKKTPKNVKTDYFIHYFIQGQYDMKRIWKNKSCK